MQLSCGEIFSNRVIEMVHRVCQFQNFENRSTFGEDYAQKCARFCGSQCILANFIGSINVFYCNKSNSNVY